MRKRLVIGLLILSVIGTAVIFFSQPKKGSVEWHKREYRSTRTQIRREMGRLTGVAPSISDRFWQTYANLTGRPIKDIGEAASARYEKLSEKLLLHELALVQLGFFAESKIPADVTNALRILPRVLRSREATDDYVYMRPQWRNSNWFMEVTAPSNAMPKWEELIRQGKVPQ